MSEPFKVVLADPGWEYNQPLKMADGVRRSSASQYQTMSVQQICDLYTPSKTNGRGQKFTGTLAGHPIADTALLGLWITAPLLIEGIHLRVCEAWGFTPKQLVPWIKGRLEMKAFATDVVRPRLVIQPGMGALTRVCVEYLLLATRGAYTKLVKSHSENGLLLAEEDSFIIEPKSKHSKKPWQQYQLLEKLFPGPYVELFARQVDRAGWTFWGDEVGGLVSMEFTEPGTYSVRQTAAGGLSVRMKEEDVPLPFVEALPEPPVSWS